MSRTCSTPGLGGQCKHCQRIKKSHLRLVLGTVFEWYDFFLYGALAAVINKQFFAGVNDTTAFIFALMAFAAGFVVRPFEHWCSAAWAT